MDPRIVFFQSLIQDRSDRILEIGPLNRPISDKRIYPNTFYCDIRSTEDIKKLYSGNDYLEKTGIIIDPETIVPIDVVLQGGYAETFKDIDKFDHVIASHVLEHMEDLIGALRDISTVMHPGGMFCIIYPDKRYCFDHFRTSASFRDAYNVFRNGPTANAPMVLDFFYSAISENDPTIFWKSEVLDHLPDTSFEDAVKHYAQVLNGAKMDDVHYWPFTDMDFLKFLYDCIRAKLIPFRCVSFCPCMKNDQQFMVALQYDMEVMSHPGPALKEIAAWMEMGLPDHYSSKDIALLDDDKMLWSLVNKQNETIKLQREMLGILKMMINI